MTFAFTDVVVVLKICLIINAGDILLSFQKKTIIYRQLFLVANFLWLRST